MSVNERCVGNWQFQAFNNSNRAVYDDDGLQLFVTALLTVPINPPCATCSWTTWDGVSHPSRPDDYDGPYYPVEVIQGNVIVSRYCER